MIRRPTAEVFGFLADFENIPKWNYAIVETHKVSQGPIGVGTIYQQVRSVPSRSEERFEVTAHNPPQQLEIQGQLGPFPSRLSYVLDAIPEGTRITNTVELDAQGTAGAIGPTPGRPFTPAAQSCS
jgi:Polyketide cyclase / dehydrase and lipid transport